MNPAEYGLWLLRDLRSRVAPTRVNGVPLPPVRYRAAGKHFQQDYRYLESARKAVEDLVEYARLGTGSRVLDIGCGSGRLAYGLIQSGIQFRSYHGVDVQQHMIDWCSTSIASRDKRFSFYALDVANPRYSPDSHRSFDGLPHLEADSRDVIFAYSVFSHLELRDAEVYLAEIRRILSASGRAVITAFVGDVPAGVIENPETFGDRKWRGPLHCVLYDKSFFNGAISAAGLSIEGVRPSTETDGQSLYILREE